MNDVEQLILDELRCLKASVATVREDVAGLKVKAGIWGAVAGLGAVAIVLLPLLARGWGH